jgi:hypothetical protein
MEIADVRRGVHETMARARQRSAERRARADAASRAFESLLSLTAVPLFRQIANALRAEHYNFNVFTPSGSVRLMSDTSAEDFIELSLDATTDAPRLVGRTSRARGRRVVDSEQVVASGDPESITEAELFAFLMRELEPFLER